MKTVRPDFYDDFKCIADKCRHSCCIGWEIDVDDDTLQDYRRFPEILRHIDTSAELAHFCLTEDERCPFLNECGLCEIILHHGEDALCQICADHPRFRNFFDSRTETGLGLCCEAAAQLILGTTDKVTLEILENDGENEPESEEEAAFFALRDRLFAIAQDRTKSIDERMDALLEAVDARMPDKPLSEWAEIFRNLECLDPARDEVLAKITDDFPESYDNPVPYEQLLVYFLYRHLAQAMDDGMFAARTAFAVLSTRMIRAMEAVTGDLADMARLYSSEVEYSEENPDEILWLLDE